MNSLVCIIFQIEYTAFGMVSFDMSCSSVSYVGALYHGLTWQTAAPSQSPGDGGRVPDTDSVSGFVIPEFNGGNHTLFCFV